MPRISTNERRRSAPAHRAPVRRFARISALGGILITTVIVGGGAFFGLAGVGGTYAFWNNVTSPNAPTVSSGSMALTVGLSGAESASFMIPTAAWSNLLPGDSVKQQVSVKVANSPSRVSSGIAIRTNAAVPAWYELRIQKGACPAAAVLLTGPTLSTTNMSLGTWTSSETSPVCVQISLLNTAPSGLQGTSTGTIGMTLTANQQ